MKTLDQMIEEFVVSSVSDHYEIFPTLSRRSRSGQKRGRCGRSESVRKALETAMHDGYVQVYELFPPVPPKWDWRPIDYSSNRLEELRFYVTPKGKDLAVKLLEGH